MKYLVRVLFAGLFFLLGCVSTRSTLVLRCRPFLGQERSGVRYLQLFTAAGRWGGCFVIAGLISYACVFWLLGFHWWSEPFSAVVKLRGQIREVVAFEQGGRCDGCLAECARTLDLTESDLVALEGKHLDSFLALEQVINLSPYPPVLRAPFSYSPYWLSLGFYSNDDRYHQVTWYGGEADTTPSLLVPKVPGRSGRGDYFVRYTVLFSRETARQRDTRVTKTG